MAASSELNRRTFLGRVMAAAGTTVTARAPGASKPRRPNLVFVFADQWRAQATGYAGDSNALTPNLDALARHSVNFMNAVSGCPVCSPYRASLMTGQYWLTHGVFLNDVHLPDSAVSIADALNGAGYRTGYIGKWHLNGRGRSSYVPPENRQGFQFWRGQECTHDYNHSQYYADDDKPRLWQGYDAVAQTREAVQYIRTHAGTSSFALILSWGPPHNPYETAPEPYRARIQSGTLALRPNVPSDKAEDARRELAGYYAHIAALDDCVGILLNEIDQTGLADDTVFVFTSDHGDMLYSQGMVRKQRPFDESVRVPFLLRYPARLGRAGRRVEAPVNTPDVMPTLLGLCGVPIPAGVEGRDFSAFLLEDREPDVDAAVIACFSPFGEWTRKQGGREYRGVRTRTHTYVRTLDGPWLLFDNEADPYQMNNLRGRASHAAIQAHLETQLTAHLDRFGDTFLPGDVYIRRFGYTVDADGTVPYPP